DEFPARKARFCAGSNRMEFHSHSFGLYFPLHIPVLPFAEKKRFIKPDNIQPCQSFKLWQGFFLYIVRKILSSQTMQMNRFEELKELLAQPKRIVILPHRNPDGDAIGSTLAMSKYLTKTGHECEIIAPNDFPKFLKWMMGAKKINIAEYNPAKCRILTEKAELIFILDFNSVSRIDEVGEWLQRSHVPKVLIDHHQEPEQFDFMYSDVNIPATCQMVYNFIEKMGDLELIDKTIAECLYTGIMTDTGNFRFRNTSAATHRVVANLHERGIEVDKIYNNVFDTQSPGRLKLLGLTLDSMETLPEFRTAYMYLTREQDRKSTRLNSS